MTANGRYRVSSPAVVSDTVDNQTIIVHLDTGSYYDLNHVGAAIWEPLERGAAAVEIVAELVARFDADRAQVERDVDALVEELVDEGLIVAQDGADTGASSPNGVLGRPEASGLPYVVPVLNKHSDMQELLLLDPVHEVDDTGWPSRR
jgi:hypothetical protein